MDDTRENVISEQVNVSMTLKDLQMIERMMREDAYDNRSAFVRRLIRQEWDRRYSQSISKTTTGTTELATQ